MAKILFVGDVHLADRPPIGRVEGYREQVLAKLEEIEDVSHQHEVDATVFLGDIFHSKRPMFTSHALVQRVQEALKGLWGYVLILPGNHDQGPEGIDSLKRQPLGVLRVVTDEILGLDVSIFELPEGGFSILARPYHPKRDLDPSYYALTEGEKAMPSPRILVCHGSLVSRDDPNWASEYHHYCLPIEDLDLSGVDVLVTGHIHEPFGPLPIGDTVVLNPGSITRTSRKPLNYTRTPKVVLFDTESRKFEDIELPVLPARDVFVTPDVETAEVTDEIRDFAESLAEGLSLEELPIEQLLAGLSGVSDDAKRIIREELEGAGV